MKIVFLPILFLGVISCLSSQGIDSISIKFIDSLIQHSRSLIKVDSFEQALKENVIAEKMALQKFGRESASYGSACYNHGRVMYYKEDYRESEKWYLEAVGIRERVLGKNHIDYTWTLFNLAKVYSNTGEYQKAVGLYIEAASIQLNLLGKDSPDYAQTLHNLAGVYLDLLDYQNAEKIYLQCLSIREKAFGNEHPDYLYSLNNLAFMYGEMGRYQEAEKIYLESIAIRKKTVGANHPDYAESLNDLAMVYDEWNNFEKAEPLYLESKNIREKSLGKESFGYTMSCNNLGVLYVSMGRFEKAEALLLEAKSIRERIIGRETKDYIMSLNNLGSLYLLLSNYQKAEGFFQEANNISEKILGKQHPTHAIYMSNLGNLNMKMGHFTQAETLFIKANEIFEIALGNEHPLFAKGLVNLGKLYLDINKFNQAEINLQEAKNIFAQVPGIETFDYAKCISILASLKVLTGQYIAAESLYLEAKSIFERVVGIQHPYYLVVLNGLANYYILTRNYELAENTFIRLSELNRQAIINARHYLSEKELNDYLLQFSNNENDILSFATLINRKKIIAVCYDNSLFYKSFLQYSTNQIEQLVLADKSSVDKFNTLKSIERQLGKEYTKLKSERKGTEELEQKVNELQKEISKSVKGFDEVLEKVSWYDVQKRLNSNEAAIEFVYFRPNKLKSIDTIIYAAILITSQDSLPQFIPLFQENELNKLLHISLSRRKEYVTNVYQLPSEYSINQNVTHIKALYELIWKPLKNKLEGIKTIYYSPSGLLHQINQNAIPVNNQEFLSDKYKLVQLSSTRELVVKDPFPISSKNTVCLIGGVNFDLDSTTIIKNHHEKDSNTVAYRGELSFSYTDSTHRQNQFNYLNGSKQEIKEIKHVCKKSGISSIVYEGNNATEESFKKLGAYYPDSLGIESPRIIHISTHGYFFPDPKEKIKTNSLLMDKEPVFKISEHPMIRSGLILAGANRAWKTGKPLRPDMEDGILTAYEISQLNLRNTELVVLSACETGLGEIQGNEGVYGLQRAFKIAGVKNLIMSLWQVPDKETGELMTLFYKNWLIKKMSIRESLLAAQNVLQDRGLTPFYWAGFVLVE